MNMTSLLHLQYIYFSLLPYIVPSVGHLLMMSEVRHSFINSYISLITTQSSHTHAYTQYIVIQIGMLIGYTCMSMCICE